MNRSIAEQSAMVLHGEAVALGDKCVSVATAVSARHRVASLPFRPHAHLTLSHGLAAWMHGLGSYPRWFDLTVQASHRFGIPLDQRVRLRRYRLKFTEDTELVHGIRVTTPLRTAIQLLTDRTCDREALTSAYLLAGSGEALEHALRHAPRLQPSMRELGLSRLRNGQPLVTL